MAVRYCGVTCLRFLQGYPLGCLSSTQNLVPATDKYIGLRWKHWNPKYKKHRAAKFIKVKLPDFNKDEDGLTPEEMKAIMKERGILPPRPWNEQTIFLSCTGDVLEAYVPPEGDGKMSVISKTGAKQKLERVQKKSKTLMAYRKIRGFDEDFDAADFSKHAQDIYISAHNCLCIDLKKLDQYVTERAYPEMVHNVKFKTIRWKFLQSLELPRVVHARTTELLTKENMFAQVTVRFHTQQLLAIYDRFGRLMHGSEILAKDVLEYVVFEKHLSNQYGRWRLHAKIIPDWLPKKDPSIRTYRVVEQAGESQTEESLDHAVEDEDDDTDEKEQVHRGKESQSPALAPA